MFKRFRWTFLGVCIGLIVAQALPGASARDQHVYDNLMRTRDALTSQRAYLQKALDDLNAQITDLQSKQKRVNDYLDETDRALRDIDRALSTSS